MSWVSQNDSQILSFVKTIIVVGKKNGQKQSQNAQALALSDSFPIRVYINCIVVPLYLSCMVT